MILFYFFFSSRRRHTRFSRDWSSDVCSSDLVRRQIAIDASTNPEPRFWNPSPLWPGGAIWPQLRIGEPVLPEHRAIVSQAGDGDRERLLQTSKTGEGRAPVRSGQLEPGDGGTAAVPADDPPGEGVGLGRPGDSEMIASRPNKTEGIPT